MSKSRKTGTAQILDAAQGVRQVFVRNLETLAHIGVHGHEQGKAQPIRINVDLAVDQSISVSGLLGSTRHLDLVAVPLLLPGTSLHERVVVPGVWPQFLLQAKVSAVPHAPVGASAAGLVPVTETTGLWAIPWPLNALVVLALLAVFAVLRARANLTGRRLARTPQVVRA